MYSTLNVRVIYILTSFVLFFLNPIYSQSETIYIDFGSGTNETATSWNDMTNNVNGNIYNLMNSNSEETGIGISITDGFEGINETGTASPDSGLNYPASATSDSFYGTSLDSGALLLSNLVIDKDYTIAIFGSRIGVSDNREASYEIIAETTQTIFLDATENTSNVASITFKPKADGTAIINVSKGPNNNNPSGFFYLGVIELTYETNTPTYSDTALFVDFGINTNPSSSYWNNLTDATITGSIDNLIDKGGNTTNISLAVTNNFNYINEEGTSGAGKSLGIPSTATEDSFFGNTAEFEGNTDPEGAIEFNNFDPNSDLKITIYASRMDYVDIDNRETQYVIEGLTTETVFLDAANNINNFVSTTLKPKADGSITITVTPGANNTNAYGFFYLGAIIIDSPLPSLTLKSPNGGEFWQVGKTPEIIWNSANLDTNIDLEYSIDNGASWNPIATVAYTLNSYEWTIPDTPSQDCLIRATSNTTTDTSDATFEISNDNSTCNIVVIGSSTAEGIGASSPENAWVNLYAKEIFQKNTALNVINLGKGGYTTYHILPTGSSTPGITIDEDRNITKALSYSPSAIIVNMPSNDTANGYTATDQLDNYAILNTEASNNSTPIWIATTQPRNFGTPALIQVQIDVRDAIISTYSANSIDFWTDIADVDGTILDNLDFGDGVHLNDAGHELLFNKVLDKNINNTSCDTNTLDTNPYSFNTPLLRIFPNPAKDKLNISFNSNANGSFTLELYNLLGEKIFQESSEFYINDNTYNFSLNNLPPQLIIGNILFENTNGEIFQKQFKLIIK